MLKLIQLGIGGMGNTWIKAVLASGRFEYAGFVDIDPQVITEQVQRYRLNPNLVFGTLVEALETVSADGILNVTPPAYHEEVSLMALDAGIPVLAEKPLALSMDSARKILRKADETGVLYLVAQDYRYTRHVQTVRQLLDSQELGPLGAIAVDYGKGPRLEGFHQQLPYPLLLDMSIHHFDLLRYLLGREPEHIYARSWNPPWSWFQGKASAVVLFEFPGEIVVSYRGTWVETGRDTTWTGDWRFECRDGTILMRGDRVFQQQAQKNTAVAGSPDPGRNLAEPVRMVEMARERQAYLLEEFYQGITSGTRPGTVVQDNINSLAMVFGAIASSEQGETIPWEQALGS